MSQNNKFTHEEMRKAAELQDRLMDMAMRGTDDPAGAILALSQAASTLCLRHKISHTDILQRVQNTTRN